MSAVRVTARGGENERAAGVGTLQLVYVVSRFPTLSETFVFNEIRTLARMGDQVTVVSRSRPEPNEPLHPEAAVFVSDTVYCPAGVGWRIRLLLACVETLAVGGRRAWRALFMSAGFAFRSPRSGAFRAFAEACAARRSVPPTTQLVHAHFAYAAPTGAALARLLGCSFSFTGHAVDIFVSVRPQLLKAQLAEARVAIATSKLGWDRMVEVAGEHGRTRVVLVRNGIDLERFQPRAFEPAGAPMVLSICRLIEKKGIDTLLEALALLCERGVDFWGEIVGDGPLRGPLEQLARQRGLGDRVRFRGPLDQLAVIEAFGRATVFVLPCRRTAAGDQDGVPNVLLEAMAVGVPIVAGSAGGVAEVVQSERSGILVEPDSPSLLADAIERVVCDQELRERLVVGGFDVTRASDLRTSVCDLRELFVRALA